MILTFNQEKKNADCVNVKNVLKPEEKNETGIVEGNMVTEDLNSPSLKSKTEEFKEEKLSENSPKNQCEPYMNSNTGSSEMCKQMQGTSNVNSDIVHRYGDTIERKKGSNTEERGKGSSTEDANSSLIDVYSFVIPGEAEKVETPIMVDEVVDEESDSVITVCIHGKKSCTGEKKSLTHNHEDTDNIKKSDRSGVSEMESSRNSGSLENYEGVAEGVTSQRDNTIDKDDETTDKDEPERKEDFKHTSSKKSVNGDENWNISEGSVKCSQRQKDHNIDTTITRRPNRSKRSESQKPSKVQNLSSDMNSCFSQK